MDELPIEMKKSFSKAKEMIESSEDIKIYSHNDCDGISAGAILSTIMDRQEKDHELEIVSLDKLEDLEIEHELTLFSDLGSGQNIDKNINTNINKDIDKLAKNSSKVIILDHHPPIRDLNYRNTVNYDYLEINPNHYGIDGSYYVSGGGLAYFLAKEFDYLDLSWIGVLAAIGDIQNGNTGKLEGLNSIILKDSIDGGYVQSINDLSLFGRKTRPLFVALSYFSDVNLPITNNRNESIALMKDLGIQKKVGDRYITLSDLDNTEKGKLFSELVKMLSREVPKKYIKHIPKLVAADSYEFMMEEDNTSLRDASEFSTAMNACMRNNREDVAIEILKGNRTTALDELEIVSKEHKRYLAQNIHKISDEDMINTLDNIQYFDGDGIKSQVVGTIAGMVLSHGDWRKPMIGFTQVSDENDNLKVSLRCSRLLAYEGIHFGNMIREIAQSVGGNGGGHSVACGAYIPLNKKEEFLTKFNNQLNGLI